VTEGRLRYHGAQDDTRQIIDSSHFCRQVEVLSRYLARWAGAQKAGAQKNRRAKKPAVGGTAGGW